MGTVHIDTLPTMDFVCKRVELFILGQKMFQEIKIDFEIQFSLFQNYHSYYPMNVIEPGIEIENTAVMVVSEKEEEHPHPNVTVRTKAKSKTKKESIDQQTWASLNKSVETYLVQFKHEIQLKLNVLELIRSDSSEEERTKMREFMEFVFEYPKLALSKPDAGAYSMTKTKETTTSSEHIETEPYCIAKRSDGIQCTRKKKKNCEYCGTHAKIEQLQSERNQSTPLTIQKMEVNAVVIHGIIYYIDTNNNVYHTEDILENKENPRIIAKAIKYGDNSYGIPDLF